MNSVKGSDAFDGFLRRMLNVRPNERPTTDELVEGLSALVGDPIQFGNMVRCQIQAVNKVCIVAQKVGIHSVIDSETVEDSYTNVQFAP